MRVRAGRLRVQRALQVGLVGQCAGNRAPCRAAARRRPRAVTTQEVGCGRRARGRQRRNANGPCQVNRYISGCAGEGQQVSACRPACRRNRLPVGRRIRGASAVGNASDLEPAPANVSGRAVLSALVDAGVNAVCKVFIMGVVARRYDLDVRGQVVRPNRRTAIRAIRAGEIASRPCHQKTPALRNCRSVEYQLITCAFCRMRTEIVTA